MATPYTSVASVTGLWKETSGEGKTWTVEDGYALCLPKHQYRLTESKEGVVWGNHGTFIASREGDKVVWRGKSGKVAFVWAWVPTDKQRSPPPVGKKLAVRPAEKPAVQPALQTERAWQGWGKQPERKAWERPAPERQERKGWNVERPADRPAEHPSPERQVTPEYVPVSTDRRDQSLTPQAEYLLEVLEVDFPALETKDTVRRQATTGLLSDAWSRNARGRSQKENVDQQFNHKSADSKEGELLDPAFGDIGGYTAKPTTAKPTYPWVKAVSNGTRVSVVEQRMPKAPPGLFKDEAPAFVPGAAAHPCSDTDPVESELPTERTQTEALQQPVDKDDQPVREAESKSTSRTWSTELPRRMPNGYPPPPGLAALAIKAPEGFVPPPGLAPPSPSCLPLSGLLFKL